MTTSPSRSLPWTRRLTDKLRLVFHAACDEGDFSVAEQRLNQLCKQTVALPMLPSEPNRRKPEDLSGACERLSNLLLWQADKLAEPATYGDEDRCDEGIRDVTRLR